MWDIITKIWICLALAAIWGGIIGWLLRKLKGERACEKCAEYEGSIRTKDAEIAKLKLAASGVSSGSANSNHEAEISKLKSQISTLEAELKTSRDSKSTSETQAKTDSPKMATLSSTGTATAGKVGGNTLKTQAGKDAATTKPAKSKSAEKNPPVKPKLSESDKSVNRDVKTDKPDDLKLINGVGPVLEKMLNNLGIYYFKDVAAWNAAKIAEMDAKLPRFKGRIVREGWVESAKEEHFKKYGERL